MEEDDRVPLILGRPLLHTANAIIRVKNKELNLGIGEDRETFLIDKTMQHSHLNDDTCFRIDVIDDVYEDELDALLDDSKPFLRTIPSFCKHKINFEDDVKTVIQRQCRLNPNMKKVVKKEIIKLLDAGIIDAIEDSPWDHFPLPFMDQMLERLAGNKFFCFLDGFSRYFQIPIEPADQEKITFTCPYGTYTYKPMPFGLCKAPSTFQRCMIAIFQDMLETSMEVFMDDFSVFEDSFDSCLTNLEQMLIRCKQARLVLNWEKCHFMITEGIVLGHKVSSKGLKVDKAKIDVIAKLPPPTNVNVVRSFLGHARFYRRFIKDFSKISGHMIKLLEKDLVFNFDEECNKAFKTLKENLETHPLWEEEINDEFPDEFLMSILTDEKESPWFVDFANYLVGGILRKGLTYAQRQAKALPINDARVVVNFLKKLFSRFEIPKALISNRGTHFCNRQMEKILKNYGVRHRIATAYHPQTSGQAYENSKLYKARTKAYHDKKIRVRKEFKAEDKVLMYNSKYKFKAPKLISKWHGQFIVKYGYPSGYVKLYNKHGGIFIVNGHRVKLYHDEEQLNELTTKEIHLMCEEGRMKAIPFMAPFPANYHALCHGHQKNHTFTV
uniref:Reverse transcriptase domain-containing protein n=1 Tax=Tanacetum cinerariifolium TaxID=118510 RepID=A0A699IN07_TANCI|nr:reverse transcriptase domain-containing protein [Tanacetum cinerariifolium]